VFYAHTLLEAERVAMSIGKKNRLLELFTVRRNRNAAIASEIVMFMQQFCGVNVIAYYSSEIFLDANFSNVAALAASLGWGTINFLMAIPAIYTIDTFGRRNLLLTTFPLMALCLLFTGFSFWIPTSDADPNPARIACITLGLYLFGIVYSPGEGPVPFTYSAEAYPLYIRPIGMSLATATTWFFNFILSVTWPSLLLAFKPQGAFSWYACWNIVGFFLVLFFMPETKERTLEELDQVGVLSCVLCLNVVLTLTTTRSLVCPFAGSWPTAAPRQSGSSSTTSCVATSRPRRYRTTISSSTRRGSLPRKRHTGQRKGRSVCHGLGIAIGLVVLGLVFSGHDPILA